MRARARGRAVAARVEALAQEFDERGGVSSRIGMNHQIHSAETSDKRFADVMGVDEAKAELQEIVMYLKNPDRFTRLVRSASVFLDRVYFVTPTASIRSFHLCFCFFFF